MREKVNSTENNISLFIKEMSDLLDSHELSTNIGSDENFSLSNSNQLLNEYEEEYSSLKNEN